MKTELNRREFVFEPGTEDDSPIRDVIQLTGRKWIRTIIERLLVDGPMRYNELSEEIDGISDKVLSDSLADLEEARLVERDVIDDRPIRVEYSLTRAGDALEPAMEAISEWTEVYLAEIDSADQ